MSTSTVSTDVEQHSQSVEPRFYMVSVSKMILMTLFTCGFYMLYWQYRNWATYKRATGDNVIPLVRTIFGIFFLYALLKRVDRGLRERGFDHKWSPGLLFAGIVLTTLVSLLPFFVPDMNNLALLPMEESIRRYLWLNMAMLLVMALQFWMIGRIQRAINVHEGDCGACGNNRLGLVNWLWMLPGMVLWLWFIHSASFLIWMLWRV